MELHSRAALTIKQRQSVKQLHDEQGISIRQLAQRFEVNPTTIQRWIKRESPLDRSTAPVNRRSVITEDYLTAVIDYRKEHPKHGPIRIAQELSGRFPWANRGTVLKILQQENLTRLPQKKKVNVKPIPVGHHRIQMDIQQLPAVKGDKGFEYKISAIHLRTRLKYSEIHSDRKSETVAGVLKRALDLLPPFSSSGLTTPMNSQ
jgi:Helix-turn-helix domain